MTNNSPGLHLLRGAIGYGEEARTSVIKNSPRIVAIPMLDTSLPRVTALERIRPGSRVFLDERLPRASTRKHDGQLLHWRHITGKGEPRPNVTEFLWPCLAYPNLAKLIDSTEHMRQQWLSLLKSKEWDPDEYAQGLMIQLDETLKLFIRSLPRWEAKRGATEYLISILPKTSHDKSTIKFEWGVWFQALKALSECANELSSLDRRVKKSIKIVRDILTREDYWDHFRAELEKPDYAMFKQRVNSLL